MYIDESGILRQVLDPLKRLGGDINGIEAIKSHPFFASDPAINFRTIWDTQPPQIETGLTPPKVVRKGQFVLVDEEYGDEDDGEMFDEDEDEDHTRIAGGVESIHLPDKPFKETRRISNEPVSKW